MLEEFEFNTKMMGCTLDVSIIADTDDATSAQVTYDAMIALGSLYETTFSRFLSQSELCLVNKNAGMATQVSALFAEVFLVAQDLFKKGSGYFNPLVQVALLGYNKPFEQIKKEGVCILSKKAIEYNTDFLDIVFNKKKSVITLQENQKLDFGAFLKGYVAQKMAALASNYPGVIVNLGGDIYTLGNDKDGNIFEFSVYNPITKKETLMLPLHHKAMATSGNYKRVWMYEGKEYSHIIESKSNYNPETDIVSATVLHQDGAFADAFATIAMTLSSKNAQIFLDAQSVEYVLITQEGNHISNHQKI